METSAGRPVFPPFDELMNKVRTFVRERGIMVRLTLNLILFYFLTYSHQNYLPRNYFQNESKLGQEFTLKRKKDWKKNDNLRQKLQVNNKNNFT